MCVFHSLGLLFLGSFKFGDSCSLLWWNLVISTFPFLFLDSYSLDIEPPFFLPGHIFSLSGLWVVLFIFLFYLFDLVFTFSEISQLLLGILLNFLLF